MARYSDLSDLSEDERIKQIGSSVMDVGEYKTVGFVVEDHDKADRYIGKLKDSFPGINIIGKGPGPIADTVLVKVGPPVQ